MKKILITITVYSILIGCLSAGSYLDYTPLIRISLWGTWAINLISVFALLADPEEYSEIFSTKQLFLRRIFFSALLVLLVATGWIVTATVYALLWFAMVRKRMIYEEEQKKKYWVQSKKKGGEVWSDDAWADTELKAKEYMRGRKVKHEYLEWRIKPRNQ